MITGLWRFAPLVVVLCGVLACVGRDAGDRRATLTILYPAGDRAFGLPEDDSPRYLVHLPLVTLNAVGEPVGRLLRRWERIPGTDTWVYHLRTDVRWHDGVPFTARDVLFTLDLKHDPDVNWFTPGRFDARLVDDSTFEVTYRQYPYGNLLHLNDWEVFYPRHQLAGLDRQAFGSWPYWIQPTGNGPYRVARHVRRTAFVLERVPDFCCGSPRIERVVLKLAEPSLAQLLSGEVDLMPIDLLGARKLRDDPRFQVHYSVNGTDRLAVVWQQGNPLFADVRVRRALALAVDRRELHRVLALPDDLPVSDAVFTLRQYLSAAPPPARHDARQAAALLDQAGWRDSDGDGVRERNGRRFQFEALANAESQAAAVYVQDQLRRLGVAMDIRTTEPGLLLQAVLTGTFDAALFAVTNELRGRRGLAALLGGISPRDGSRGLSPLGYRNPRASALLDALEAALYPAEIDSLYRELSPHLEADLPILFLAPRVSAWAAHRRVRGLSGHRSADPFYYIEHLWLDGGR